MRDQCGESLKSSSIFDNTVQAASLLTSRWRVSEMVCIPCEMRSRVGMSGGCKEKRLQGNSRDLQPDKTEKIDPGRKLFAAFHGGIVFLDPVGKPVAIPVEVFETEFLEQQNGSGRTPALHAIAVIDED